MAAIRIEFVHAALKRADALFQKKQKSTVSGLEIEKKTLLKNFKILLKNKQQPLLKQWITNIFVLLKFNKDNMMNKWKFLSNFY